MCGDDSKGNGQMKDCNSARKISCAQYEEAVTRSIGDCKLLEYREPLIPVEPKNSLVPVANAGETGHGCYPSTCLVNRLVRTL